MYRIAIKVIMYKTRTLWSLGHGIFGHGVVSQCHNKTECHLEKQLHQLSMKVKLKKPIVVSIFLTGCESLTLTNYSEPIRAQVLQKEPSHLTQRAQDTRQVTIAPGLSSKLGDYLASSQHLHVCRRQEPLTP